MSSEVDCCPIDGLWTGYLKFSVKYMLLQAIRVHLLKKI